jgi:hypothetical protein
VSQADNHQRWVSLGTFEFRGNGDEYVSLSDLTYEPYLSRRIVYDAVRWVRQDTSGARDALQRFFSALHEGRYAEAAARFGGDYSMLQEWNPTVDPDDHAKLLELGCEVNGLVCLPIGSITKEVRVSESDDSLTVEFIEDDGSVFSHEAVGSQFDYVVRKAGYRYLVLGLPIYLP